MSKTWPRVQLANILSRVRDEVIVKDDEVYARLTIRMNGRGIVLRDQVLGHEIGTKKQFISRSGQLVLSKIDARNGAFGLLPSECDNAIITGNFWAFDFDKEKLVPSYFDYLTKTPLFVEFCVRASEGTTNRLYLQEDLFLAQEISLPPLDEQRRIVSEIDNFSNSIETVIKLSSEKLSDADSLLVSMAHRADLSEVEKKNSGWKRQKLGEVIRLVSHAETVKLDAKYPNLGIYSFGRGLFHKPPISGLGTSAKSLYRVRRGQFIYSRLFAFEGAYGMVEDEFDGKFVSNEYPTFECNADAICPEFLVAYFKPSSIWARVAEGSKGLGDRRQRVQPAQILNHELWLPPIAWQKRLIEVKKRIDQIRKESATAQAEVEALMPAILDRAFKGEL